MNRLLVALLCCVSFIVPACADATDGPIKLGVILDMGGPYMDLNGPGSEAAARMAIDDFGGSVLGRQIELSAADHQNKPDIAAAIATRWFDAEGFTAILDVAASSPALAVMNVANQRHKIVMMSAPGAQAITNEACIATAVHYNSNTYASAHTIGSAVVAEGGKTWFFLAADYTFGQQLVDAATQAIVAGKGKVLGDARAPLDTPDFSSFLIRAQASGAEVIGLANAGGDTVNSVKQAAEFGLMNGKTKFAALSGSNFNDVMAVGLDTMKHMLVVDSFYWDLNDATRSWSKRYFDRVHKMPNSFQAALYSETMHYLQAVKAVGSTDAAAVMQKMRDMPVDDFYATNGHIRPDGMMAHDMYMFEVKTPAESTSRWDVYKLISKVPADQAFLPLSESKCPLVSH
jgi:branched-chain amino acid transport system substrate-binding protein